MSWSTGTARVPWLATTLALSLLGTQPLWFELPTLAQPGTWDASFSAPMSEAVPTCLALQADGKLVTAGLAFNSIQRWARDGRADPDFRPAAVAGVVHGLAVQADGRIVFATTSTVQFMSAELHRLLADGSPDASFTNAAQLPKVYGPIEVQLRPQPDGKILVASIGAGTPYVGRVNADGTADATFVPPGLAWGSQPGVVWAMEVDAAGGVWVGGRFTTVGGESCSGLARLRADGGLDRQVSPAQFGGDAPTVRAIGFTPEGQIVVGGLFSSVNGVARDGLARLNADGSLDTGFAPVFPARTAWGNTPVNVVALAVRTNGSVFVAARPESGAEVPPAECLVRFGPDGAWDASFRPEVPAGASVARLNQVVLQPDGQLLLRDGLGANRMAARLNGDFAPDIVRQPESLTLTPGSEAAFTVGLRDSGGVDYQWFKDGFPLPGETRAALRLGVVNGALPGDYTVLVANSVGAVRSAVARLVLTGLPDLASEPGDTTVPPGSEVRLEVAASTPGPWNYQWLKDGQPLPGETNAALVLTDARGRDVGFYAAVVSGCVTSRWALVNVRVPPEFVGTPANRAERPGATVVLTAGAIGGLPIHYQWSFNDLPLPGQTNATLSLADFQAANEGLYSVTASNEWGGAPGVPFSLTAAPWPAGTVDARFDPPADEMNRLFAAAGVVPWEPGLGIHTVAAQANGSVLAAAKDSATVVRLTPDGARVAAIPCASDAVVQCLAAYPDGGFLVSLKKQYHDGNRILRFLANGSQDSRFRVPGVGDSFPAGTNELGGALHAIVIPSDGQALLGGDFYGAPGFGTVARLGSDAVWDSSFAVDAVHRAEGSLPRGVRAMVRQPDGRIWVGGCLDRMLARLQPDGTLDASFDPQVNGPVSAMALQEDGGVVIGGEFTAVAGTARPYVARLFPDGRLDPGFDPGTGPDAPVRCLALNRERQVLIGGAFDQVAGAARGRLAKLQPDGTLDADFNPTVEQTRAGAGATVNTLAVQPDGRVLIGGVFDRVGGVARQNLARLYDLPAKPAPVAVLVPLGYDTASGFSLRVRGAIGARYRIETSTNLLDWQPLRDIVLSATAATVTDTPPTSGPARYYRASVW